jgi:energy-coupling factor transport system permease protein
MFKNVTIGQYYPAESPIHALDPRTKLISALAYIFLLFFVGPFAGYVVAAFALWAAVLASKVPVGYVLRGLRGIMFVIVFTAALNIFLTPGETVLLSWRFITINYEGVTMAVKMTVRLALLVASSSVLTLTTTPTQLTDAIETLLKPLKRVKAPVHEVAMMMTIALRFIPTLMDETDKIMKAQTARGANFDAGGIIKKAKALVPLLVPLFLSAIRRAEDLAVAMEARCYRGDINRTKMKVTRLRRADFMFLGVMALLGCGVLAINRFLAGRAF